MFVDCPQCGEWTEMFADGLCSDCSLANQMELDDHYERFEEWDALSRTAREVAIFERSRVVEHDYRSENDSEGSVCPTKEED